MLHTLHSKWCAYTMPYNAPINEIGMYILILVHTHIYTHTLTHTHKICITTTGSYFGQKPALYLLFTGTLSNWLYSPAILGCIVMILREVSGDYSSFFDFPTLPVISFFIAMWISGVCMCMFVSVCIYVCIYVCMCMYVCVCMCMYVCMYVNMYVNMYVYVCEYVCVCMCICICMCICMCIYMYVYMYVHMYLYVYMYVYIYVCVYVCVYVYA